MGIRDRRAVKHMKDPVRGVFTVAATEFHAVIGPITAPGIAPTRVEHRLDGHEHGHP